MSDFSNSLAISASGMAAQTDRLRFTSENIANADTPGYRRKTTSFEAIVEQGQSTGAVTTGPMVLDKTELDRVFDPSHPMADASGYYQGTNVDLLIEIADAREAQRSYEANLKMFDQSRQMSSSLMELLRR
ncbi:flagellar basal body rod protein FlgC [Thalassobium sp. R2A62]|jgi:flagellar basal-body rod protein FlgC|uniref:flagellar basal body rod protein FlgC n=1 Tax=Thalassobium sp. R2A62 TaxID=633131 RepID=UPI0001B1D7EF|nr:flagellar basal body rod protein FlgC [Thalassobium sp. R2A62]EET49387.1 flagellar basal-body rod protein FlgC [Thalassobium sp. R2A62]MDG1340103.1 flagellar basal body rod protein FlgC [Paracoccaceae bacterium]MDG1803102.1 flagellar basal body rod protein FlgC [Paracoccaceae bacterium]MDG2453371.1 flagellar basal body rod protein FlgC [Paracoccaceae bacterium]